MEGQVFYTDEKASYLFSGNLLDMRGAQPRNLTQETMGKLAAAALSKSTGSAVKRVKGSGKRVIYTFEDPNCGYCKELQKELVKLNDVTIYTFLWPILSQDSVDKSKAIWCAADRAKGVGRLHAQGHHARQVNATAMRRSNAMRSSRSASAFGARLASSS